MTTELTKGPKINFSIDSRGRRCIGTLWQGILAFGDSQLEHHLEWLRCLGTCKDAGWKGKAMAGLQDLERWFYTHTYLEHGSTTIADQFSSHEIVYSTPIEGSFIETIMMGRSEPARYSLEMIAAAIEARLGDVSAHWFYVKYEDNCITLQEYLYPYARSDQPHIGFTIPIQKLEEDQADQGGDNALYLVQEGHGWVLRFYVSYDEEKFNIEVLSSDQECKGWRQALEKAATKMRGR